MTENNESKRSRKYWLVPVVVILMLLSSLVGWYIGDKGILSAKKDQQTEEKKELTPEEQKRLETEKLKAALLKDGYKETSDNYYTKEVKKIDKPDGSFLNWDIYYFDLESLTYSRITALDVLRISTNVEYSIRTNIASGSTQFFEEESNQWEDQWRYTYNFNSGSGTCQTLHGNSCSDTSLVTLKNEIDSFLANNDIKIELIK